MERLRKFRDKLIIRSNRTFMELKSETERNIPEREVSSNRTFMELKFGKKS